MLIAEPGRVHGLWKLTSVFPLIWTIEFFNDKQEQRRSFLCIADLQVGMNSYVTVYKWCAGFRSNSLIGCVMLWPQLFTGPCNQILTRTESSIRAQNWIQLYVKRRVLVWSHFSKAGLALSCTMMMTTAHWWALDYFYITGPWIIST